MQTAVPPQAPAGLPRARFGAVETARLASQSNTFFTGLRSPMKGSGKLMGVIPHSQLAVIASTIESGRSSSAFFPCQSPTPSAATWTPGKTPAWPIRPMNYLWSTSIFNRVATRTLASAAISAVVTSWSRQAAAIATSVSRSGFRRRPSQFQNDPAA